jgi:pimeloyl-ACP methyl ester carboxylesterase
MSKEIYLISGLGADERVFQRLDYQHHKPIYIHWIAPKHKESIRDYATRLLTQITSEKPWLLGVSFGGMIATEIAQQMDCEGIILVSTTTTREEIPVLYRLAGKLHLHRCLPTALLKRANAFTCWLFGMKTIPEKQLLKSILQDTERLFLSWAINAILHWDNRKPINYTLRLHGSKDRILPISNLNDTDVVILDGGHLMIYSNADTVNAVLQSMPPFSSREST